MDANTDTVDGTVTEPPAEQPDQPAEQPEQQAQADMLEQIEATVRDAELLAAQVEGLVAELLLATVVDESVSGDPMDAKAITASLVGRVPRPDRETVADLAARLAAIQPDGDLAARVETLMERLRKLEATVVELMDAEVDDMALPEDEPSGS